MNSKLLHSIVIVSLLLAVFLLSGCTVIGMAVGYNADRAARKKATGPSARAALLKPGRRVTVTYTNGQEMTGVYRGLRQRPASEYIPVYEESCSNLCKPASLAVGDTLSVALQTGKTVEAPLAGFGLQHLWLKSPEQDSLTKIASSDIAEVTDSRGVVLDTPSLRSMMACNAIPSIVTLRLQQGSDDVDVPGDSVSQVRVHVKPHYWLIGGGIGLLVDAAVIGLLIYAAVQSMDFGGGGGGFGTGGGGWY